MMPLMRVPDGPVLVVDDDPKIVALVRTYLERERYAVDAGYAKGRILPRSDL